MRRKFLWDFEIQTNHLISARRPELIIVNEKKSYRIVDFTIPADHRVKLKESEKKAKYLDLARELKNCGTWKWKWNQLLSVLLVQPAKDL